MQPGTFVTMFYGVLETATGRLRYASAGHSPTLVYRAATGDTHWIHSGGIPLGAVRGGALGATLRDQHIVLGQGDLLVQFTDGVNEALAADASGPFGFDRLAETVATLVPGGGREVITGIQAALAQWTGGDSPHDDETMLVVSREAVPRDRPTTPESGLSCGDGRTALGALARARRSGHALNLNASIDALPTIRQWIDTCPALRDLGAHELVVLESGLYELCANIIEHGYRERDTETLTLWWLPSPAITPGARHVDRPGLADRGEDGQISDGLFVILDRGRPFGIDDGAPGGSPDARRGRRGRGLGLGIIRNAMRFVRYHPGTEAGNITLAGFDPGQTPGQRTARPGAMSS
jgi:anti-sigma regulatory factor (Ser/Thr protein kinase)